jgi:ribonuclease P protein component
VVSPRLTFPRRLRLTHAREFDAIYKAKVQRQRGPLTLYSLPNSLTHSRLGLSVGKRVGGAVARNRLKRLLREAFRLTQRDLPTGAAGGYDLILIPRPHQPLALDDYKQLLLDLAAAAHRDWERKAMSK